MFGLGKKEPVAEAPLPVPAVPLTPLERAHQRVVETEARLSRAIQALRDWQGQHTLVVGGTTLLDTTAGEARSKMFEEHAAAKLEFSRALASSSKIKLERNQNETVVSQR
jgi:hypothetical protein